ncbi:MAG: DUF2905 domain-containing protein [Chitinophagaceae bacterium]
MNAEAGKFIIIAGAVILIAGVIVYFFHDKFHWIGHLPGDIRVERDNFRFYLPITTMIAVSILLSVILQVIRKMF